MTNTAYVYILSNRKRGALYTGVTSNLELRMYQHKHKLRKGFASNYNLNRLVWYQEGEDISAAISLEKKIKNRSRKWKIELIERRNPNWKDLSSDSGDSATPLRYAQNDEGGMLRYAQNDEGGVLRYAQNDG